MYKNSFFRFLPECKSTRKAMSYMLFMQCMGLRPVVKEILPFLCYVAILCCLARPSKPVLRASTLQPWLLSRRSERDALNHPTHLSSASPLVWIAATGQGFVPRERSSAHQTRAARLLTRAEQHNFLCFTCALGGGMLWEMNNSTHFNHQLWQWRWQWIFIFNWISLERNVCHGGK